MAGFVGWARLQGDLEPSPHPDTKCGCRGRVSSPHISADTHREGCCVQGNVGPSP